MTTSEFARRNHWPTALPAFSTVAASTRGAYWPGAVLALVALSPALINFTALDMVSPTIAQNLGVSIADASWVPLLGNAALPLGFLVGAGFMTHVSLRRVAMTAVCLLVVATLGAALAQNLPVLVIAHAVQGFASGLLGSAIVLAVAAGTRPSRVPMTVLVLGTGLFGAATLGPLVGGVLQQAGVWRELFIVELVLALLAMLLVWAIVVEAPASQVAPFGGLTVWIALAGLALLFIGIGELYYYHYTRPQVVVPAMLGVCLLVALIAFEWAHRGAIPMRRLAGAPVLASVASFGFGGLLAVLIEFLQQIRGLGAQDTGMLLWPSPAAALFGLILAGLIFSRPAWAAALGLLGVLLLAVVAWQLMYVTQYTGNDAVMFMAALLGFGASVSIAPAMLMGALSVPGSLVGRALSLTVFFPYIFLASSGPVMTYVTSVRQTIHYTNLLWQQGFSAALSTLGRTSSGQSSTATTSDNLVLLNRALVFGINDAAFILLVVIGVGAGVAAIAVRIGLRQRSAIRTQVTARAATRRPG